MSTALLEKYKQDIEDTYRQMTPKSGKMLETARKYVAGGVTRETCWWEPYPMFVERGEGCQLFDIDGNSLLDYSNNFTASLLGHVHPKVLAAIQEAAPKLLSAAGATESIHQWAKILCDRYLTVEKVRFCCSGSEAVLFACRAARAYTGKDKIMKQRGSYHGTLDAMEVDMPSSQRGIPKHAGADMLYVDLSNLEEAEQAIKDNQGDLAGVLVNPIWFTRQDGKLRALRELTEKYGTLLIVDEVMSFRYARGGAQEYFGFPGDITAFGKFIGGGGLAVGAFGGRTEIMSLFSYLDEEKPAHHSGTFAANPLTVAAGIAALTEMTPDLVDRLNGLGERLREGFRSALRSAGIKGFVASEGSLCLMGLGEPAMDPRRAESSPVQREIARLFGLALLNKRQYTPAGGMIWSISSPMTQGDIDETVGVTRETLESFKPLITEAAPEFLQE